jgi:hypothetical protein
MKETRMKNRMKMTGWTLIAATAFALTCAPFAVAQTHPAAAIAMQAPSESDVANTQEQLLKLLRLSPVLTTVVARDPSLLGDQAYVARNNPELAQFLTEHPDIAKNPEFYLFSHLEQGRGRREDALERAVWPNLAQTAPWQGSRADAVLDKLIPLIGIPAFFFIMILIIRLFLESRRWNRALKVQSEVHSKLIDRFSSSQDLAAYMQTESGKKFLEASPMALGADASMQMPNVVARVLTPLTAGIVLVLSGIGLVALRGIDADMTTPMLVLGTLALMPGIGFILSAGATWIVAKRLDMLPERKSVGGAQLAHTNPIDRS